MPGSTNIEWTDKSWNPTTGCTQVSPGCAHCYAKTMTERFHGPGSFDTVVMHDSRLKAPFSWKKPARVFVNSMSDLFHEDIPDEFIDRVFAVMALTPQHTYQVLTKRPGRMNEYLAAPMRHNSIELAPEAVARFLPRLPLPNVWLGVTVENQHWADVRIPILLDTPATVRFISAEPLLARLRLWPTWFRGSGGALPVRTIGLDWVIVGGESGPKHRPFDPRWAQEIVDVCRIWDCAAFVKQLGGNRPGNKLEDLPEDLRVREYPVRSIAG